MPLVFLQTQTLGITANASGGQATPELTLGYRDLDIAVVPVSDANGVPVRSVNPEGKANGGGQFQDALSVLGQFDVNTNAGTAVGVGLGKFFATGTAASKLAEGFKYKLAGAAPKAPPF